MMSSNEEREQTPQPSAANAAVAAAGAPDASVAHDGLEARIIEASAGMKRRSAEGLRAFLAEELALLSSTRTFQLRGEIDRGLLERVFEDWVLVHAALRAWAKDGKLAA